MITKDIKQKINKTNGDGFNKAYKNWIKSNYLHLHEEAFAKLKCSIEELSTHNGYKIIKKTKKFFCMLVRFSYLHYHSRRMNRQ